MAMDLIALYNDGLASKDSRDAVKEHLHSCPSCAKAYAGYKNAVNSNKKSVETIELTPEELNAKYKSIAKDLHKRYIISTGVTLLITAMSVGLGVMSLNKLKEMNRIKQMNEAKENFIKNYFN